MKKRLAVAGAAADAVAPAITIRFAEAIAPMVGNYRSLRKTALAVSPLPDDMTIASNGVWHVEAALEELYDVVNHVSVSGGTLDLYVEYPASKTLLHRVNSVALAVAGCDLDLIWQNVRGETYRGPSVGDAYQLLTEFSGRNLTFWKEFSSFAEPFGDTVNVHVVDVVATPFTLMERPDDDFLLVQSEWRNGIPEDSDQAVLGFEPADRAARLAELAQARPVRNSAEFFEAIRTKNGFAALKFEVDSSIKAVIEDMIFRFGPTN